MKESEFIIQKIIKYLLVNQKLPGNKRSKPFYCTKKVNGKKVADVFYSNKAAAKFFNLKLNTFDTQQYRKKPAEGSFWFRFDAKTYLSKVIRTMTSEQKDTLLTGILRKS